MDSIYAMYDAVKESMEMDGFFSKYFDQDFYFGFCADYLEKINEAVLNGCFSEKDSGYKRTKESLFYKKDSSAYCRFLEIFHSKLEHFRLEFYTDSRGTELVHVFYESYPDITTAKNMAKIHAKNLGVKYYEIIRAA